MASGPHFTLAEPEEPEVPAAAMAPDGPHSILREPEAPDDEAAGASLAAGEAPLAPLVPLVPDVPLAAEGRLASGPHFTLADPEEPAAPAAAVVPEGPHSMLREPEAPDDSGVPDEPLAADEPRPMPLDPERPGELASDLPEAGEPLGLAVLLELEAPIPALDVGAGA